ncbi:mandelate racemase/muconate lactonizing enzyme family protein [Brevibacillus fulvus]|uniref:D-galactarolactone cycloisomerase n=1 Tax=Brevibacillus fulvus TaxID=1125967 RepID=A0A938XSU0_9BACL|nr:mandelate racemase/muconate lactonizing enzyme family protein [Brevibacillus fulvus]MBM7589342.1 D-galactarolactone cycloisomerase [Brevibacillus fulvus]
MEIERIETYPLLHRLEQPYGDANGLKKYRSCYLIRIITRSGIDGWGEIIDWLPTLEKGMQERIIPYLLGKKATDRLQLVKVIKKWHQRAAAGISMALTEIVAKQAGLSICDLWGGRFHTSIPVYASFQSYCDEQTWMERSLQLVEKVVTAGFSQIKVKIGGRTLKEDQAHITRLQAMVGNEVQIAIDGNQSYDLATTLQWQKLLHRYENWLWLEEPMPLSSIAEYRLLRGQLPLAVAGGENLLSAKQFVPLLQANALDILQPDSMHQDGVDGFRATLQLGRSFGLRVSPHAYDGVLSRLYALFAQACLQPWSKMSGEKIEPIEWDVMENPFTHLLPLQPVAGTVKLPNGPGIGMEFDRERLNAYRWNGSTYV